MALKLTSLLMAATVAVTALAPTLAEARDHGGYRDRGYDRGYSRGHDRGYRHDNDGDALAAGVIGLALGAVIGSAITSSNQPPRYYQPPPRSYYPAPPAAYYPPPPPQGGYYGQTQGYQQGYAAGPPVCVLRERQWDPYAGQYVRVERRIPC